MSAGRTTTNPEAHWQEVYRTKDESECSWHQDEPTRSLELIQAFSDSSASVIDIGGGSSLLAARLTELGYLDVTVLDIAPAAIAQARKRIGVKSDHIRWMAGDVTRADNLPKVDIWHDRAVFHFLTQAMQRAAYVDRVRGALKPGGHVIIATFALAGPEQCSGLPVVRYDAASLAREFGPGFKVVKSCDEDHVTPWGKTQAFTYTVLARVDTISHAHDALADEIRTH